MIYQLVLQTGHTHKPHNLTTNRIGAKNNNNKKKSKLYRKFTESKNDVGNKKENQQRDITSDTRRNLRLSGLSNRGLLRLNFSR